MNKIQQLYRAATPLILISFICVLVQRSELLHVVWADINLMEMINVLLFLAEIHVVPVLWNILLVLAVLSILSRGWK